MEQTSLTSIKTKIKSFYNLLKSVAIKNIEIEASPDEKSKIVKILQQIPKKHLLSINLVKIKVSKKQDFLAKYNNRKKTIEISSKVFTKKYTNKRPFHRIKTINSLTELLTHEIGHSVEEAIHSKNKEIIDPLWHDITGWVYPKNARHIKELRKKGFVSALKNFRTIAEEDKKTLSKKDIGDIERKIMKRFPMQKRGQEQKLSWYAKVSPREDFSESYVNFVYNNETMKNIEPERWGYMKEYVFKGEGCDN